MKILLNLACIACVILTIVFFHFSKENNDLLCDFASAVFAFGSFYCYMKSKEYKVNS